MLRHVWTLVFAGVAVAGCTKTADDLRAEPVRFSVTVPTAWNRLTTCIKTAFMDSYSVVDLPNPEAQRTEVVIQQMATFDIRGTTAGTVVAFRRRAMVMNDERFDAVARGAVERCDDGGTPIRY